LSEVSPEKKIELQDILNKHFYFSARKVATIHNLEEDTAVNRVQMNLTYRDETEDKTDPKNKIYTISVSPEAVHSDLVLIKYYTIEGSKEVLLRSHYVKNDSTPLFTWNDTEWAALTVTNEYINKSGPTFTFNNLVYINQFLNTSTDVYEDVYAVVNSKLLLDFRIPTDTGLDIVTRINGNTLRFIPAFGPNEFAMTVDTKVVSRIELEFYAVDIDRHNGTKLVDYSKDTIIDDIPLWHPQAESFSTVALRDIDYKITHNPAKYNHVPNTFRDSTFTNTQYWDSNQIGTTWWDLSKLDYIPYYDTTIYPLLQDRISRWGKLADYSTVSVYEWTESSVPPADYDSKSLLEQSDFGIDESVRTTGTVALAKYVRRQRIWWSRPITWVRLETPAQRDTIISPSLPVSTGSALGLQDTRMILSGQSGTVWVTIDNGSFDNYGIKEGTLMCGWGNEGYNTSEENKPFGQLQFGGEESSLIGQDISDDYFVDSINNPGTYPLNPLFSKIKSRSSEMSKVYNGLSGPAALTFKNKWLVSSVTVTQIDLNKPIKVLSSIDFEIRGFVWDAHFINNELVPGTLFPITNRKGVNDDKMTLVLKDETYEELIEIQGSYICSNNKPIVFDFVQSNIRVTFNINQQNFDAAELGAVYYAHPVYDLFGGKHEIENISNLDPSLTSTQLKSFTDRDGEFYKFDTYTGGVPTGVSTTGSVYIS
jgi:hypothetical protein